MSSTPAPAARLSARAAIAALALLAAGCGLGEGEASEGEATLTVSRDYGAEVLRETAAEDPPASETVLRLLDDEAELETRYGGGFVQSIDGLSGGFEDARRSDWFFYVNGTESAVGAAEVDVAAGDRIWWDLHDWTDVMRVPAVVGSWPAPFATAEPARIECFAEAATCEQAESRIEQASGEAPATGADDGGPRVLVGPWGELRRDPGAAPLERSPSRSGVFAGFAPAGGSWELVRFDQELAEADRLGAGAGLVAAVEGDAQEPVWLVTGTDEAGAAAAAELLEDEVLENRFAVATTGSGEPLPLPAP